MSGAREKVQIVFLFRLLKESCSLNQSVRLMDPDIDVGAAAQTKIGPNLHKVGLLMFTLIHALLISYVIERFCNCVHCNAVL
jgi:hypothetical protein